jgi:hypothetical protein
MPSHYNKRTGQDFLEFHEEQKKKRGQKSIERRQAVAASKAKKLADRKVKRKFKAKKF